MHKDKSIDIRNRIHGIHRTTLLVLAVAITFGSFSVYKALGGRSPRGAGTLKVSSASVSVGRNKQRDVPALQDLGSTILTAADARPLSDVRTELIPIEQIRVGERVLAKSPTGDEDLQFGSDIIPADWRKLTLQAPKRDGTVAEIVLLRPLTWLNEQRGAVGGTMLISVPECGIDGNAQVLGIDPCPEIPSGAGRVVTGTFRHQAARTITLIISGEREPIGCTGNHPFWSEDRQDFVRADSLQPGETLRTPTGLTTVESWTLDLNPTPVYNIEVHVAHVYHVGASGVVVHNGDVEDCIKWVQRMRDKIGGEVVHMTPAAGQRGIGKLPDYDYSQSRSHWNPAELQHAFIIKDGKIFDAVHPKGISAAEWFGEYMDKNGIPSMTELLYWIDFSDLSRGFSG